MGRANNLKILSVHDGSWKKNSETWKSSGNLFLKKGYRPSAIKHAFLFLSIHIYHWFGFVRLQGIIADLENKLDKQAADHARSTVARDLELEALRQQEEKMRLGIAQIRETTERFKINL